MSSNRGPLWYGPFSYGGPLVVGFITGAVGFILLHAVSNIYKDAELLPIVLAWMAGGTALMGVATLVANYVVGRQIRAEKAELSMIPNVPAPLPPDAATFMLRKSDVPARRPVEQQQTRAA